MTLKELIEKQNDKLIDGWDWDDVNDLEKLMSQCRREFMDWILDEVEGVCRGWGRACKAEEKIWEISDEVKDLSDGQK